MSDYFTDDTLANKLGILDPAQFKEIEQRMVAEKSAHLLNSDVPDELGEAFFKHIHGVLFDELYDFAGNYRTVDITKHESSTPFAYARFLGSESQRIFDELRAANYFKECTSEQFIVAISNLASELNALHPFREGNGRVIRLYLILLAYYAGYLLDYSRVSTNELINADIRAFEGNDEPLLKVYQKITIKV